MSFPNNLGGYVRAPKKVSTLKPMTPRERFHRLIETFLTYRADPWRHGKPGRQRNYAFWGDCNRVLAPTRSEARAALKKLLGIKSTAGIPVCFGGKP